MQRIVVSCFVVAMLVLITLPLQSIAQPPQQKLDKRLKGDYDFTLIKPCVQSIAGFGTDLDLLSNGGTRVTSIQGTITYNGDGTGTSSSTSLNNFNKLWRQLNPVSEDEEATWASTSTSVASASTAASGGSWPYLG